MLIFLGALLLTWLVAASVLIGAGTLLLRAASPNLVDVGLGERFWVGLSGAVGFLVVWNSFLPVDSKARWAVAIAGMAGWLIDRRTLLRQCLRLFGLSRRELGVFLLFVLAVGYAAAGMIKRDVAHFPLSHRIKSLEKGEG